MIVSLKRVLRDLQRPSGGGSSGTAFPFPKRPRIFGELRGFRTFQPKSSPALKFRILSQISGNFAISRLMVKCPGISILRRPPWDREEMAKEVRSAVAVRTVDWM